MASKRSASRSSISLSTSPTLQHACAIGIASAAIAARTYVSWRTQYTAPDALITLRYAENLATGHGFTNGAGEHVLGVIGPLYALLLSVFASAHLNPLVLGKACNIAADGVTCYLLARLMARSELARPVEGLFAAALYAFSSTAFTVSISGTEGGLVTCVGLAMAYAYVVRRPYWLYALGAVLVLLNIYGLVLFSVLASTLALRERKIPQRAGAIALIITIPWLIFATAYFGSPVPRLDSPPASAAPPGVTSFSAAGTSLAHRGLQAFSTQFASDWIQWALCLLFALGAILVVCLAIQRAERGVLAAPLLWCMTYSAMMISGLIPSSPSYLLPLLPLYIAIACLAGATAPMKLGKMRPDLAAKWAVGAVPGALIVLLFAGMIHIRAIVFEAGAQNSINVSTPKRPISTIKLESPSQSVALRRRYAR